MTDILYLHSFVLQLHTKLNWYMVATGQLMIQKNSLRLGKLQKVYLEKKKWNFRENSKNLNDIKMDWSHFYLWFVKNILLHGRTSFWENLEAVPHVQYLTFCIIWSAQLYFDQEICYRKLQTFIWQPHSIWLEDCK